jgi:hypothetical protein
MVSWNETKQRIRTAINAGQRPRVTDYGGSVLNLRRGRGSSLLVQRVDGGLTRAGRYYYEQVQQSPPNVSFDPNQALIRGNHGDDYIMMRDGSQKLVRSLKPSGEYKLTRTGAKFFRNRYLEVIAHLPVYITGVRSGRGPKAGESYEREDYIPVAVLGLGVMRQPEALSDQEILRNVRSEIYDKMNVLRTENGRSVIHEESSETYSLNRDKEILISTQTTRAIDGRAEVEVSMAQFMRGFRNISYQLPHSDALMEEAFDDSSDNLCVVRQLSKLLALPQKDVEVSFDHIVSGRMWRSTGLTPEEVKDFCVYMGSPMLFISPRGTLIHKYEPPRKLNRCVAFACFDGHFYCYENARVVAQAVESEGQLLKNEKREEIPPFSQWKAWDSKVEVGYFYCDDLRRVRKELLEEHRISPKVSLKSLAQISQLTCRSKGGRCVIREVSDDVEAIQAWIAALPIEHVYRGQGLASISLEVFSALLKAERLYPTQCSRDRILESQSHACNLCGSSLADSGAEFDHVQPLKMLFAGSAQTYQALCATCHRTKTELESKQGVSLESRFSARVYRAYVQSPKLPPLVFEANKSDEGRPFEGIDVCRCRRNAMVNAPFDFALFSPFDSVEKPVVDGILADFSFVEMSTNKCELDVLPFLGSGWYPKVAVAHMLETGTIGWHNIEWVLHASAHVQPAIFAKALDIMRAAWPEEHISMDKLSVNALIGMMARQTDHTFCVRSSTNSVDGTGSDYKSLFAFGNGESITDYVWINKLIGNASMRPIHDAILGFEAVMVSKIRKHLQTIGVDRRYIRQCKTDCLLLQGLPKKYRAQVQKICCLTYKDGEPKYRWEDDLKPLKGCYKKPKLHSCQVLASEEWTEVDDPMEHCLSGCSLLLLGGPGCGKTYLARQIAGALTQKGEVVDLISKTHVACMNLHPSAKTVDHYVRRHIRHGQCRGTTWLIIEEITMIDPSLWADLCTLEMVGRIRMLLLGDFKQFASVVNSWYGCSLRTELKDSEMLKGLAQGCYHVLTENRRSDQTIFDFITSLKIDEPGELDLETALERARALFPVTGATPDTTLVISHARRIAINKRVNEKLKPPDAICIKAPHEKQADNACQDMHVWPGLRLIGAGGRVHKGLFVCVTACDSETVSLDNGLVLEHEAVQKCLRLSHSITFASSQGLTLHGRVRLECSNRHFTPRHLYVGCSRCTHSSLLEVL